MASRSSPVSSEAQAFTLDWNQFGGVQDLANHGLDPSIQARLGGDKKAIPTLPMGAFAEMAARRRPTSEEEQPTQPVHRSPPPVLPRQPKPQQRDPESIVAAPMPRTSVPAFLEEVAEITLRLAVCPNYISESQRKSGYTAEGIKEALMQDVQVRLMSLGEHVKALFKSNPIAQTLQLGSQERWLCGLVGGLAHDDSAHTNSSLSLAAGLHRFATAVATNDNHTIESYIRNNGCLGWALYCARPELRAAVLNAATNPLKAARAARIVENAQDVMAVKADNPRSPSKVQIQGALLQAFEDTTTWHAEYKPSMIKPKKLWDASEKMAKSLHGTLTENVLPGFDVMANAVVAHGGNIVDIKRWLGPTSDACVTFMEETVRRHSHDREDDGAVKAFARSKGLINADRRDDIAQAVIEHGTWKPFI